MGGITNSQIEAGENVIVDSLGKITATNITATGWVDIVSYDDISYLNIASDDGIYIDTYGSLDTTAIAFFGEIGIIANGDVTGEYAAMTDAWVFTYGNFDAGLFAMHDIYYVVARGNISGWIDAGDWIDEIYSYGNNRATISATSIGYIEAYIPDEEHETNASITGKITASEWIGRILADGDITAEITSPEIALLRENDETAETWETIPEALISAYDEIFEAIAEERLSFKTMKDDTIEELRKLQEAYKKQRMNPQMPLKKQRLPTANPSKKKEHSIPLLQLSKMIFSSESLRQYTQISIMHWLK